MQKNSVTEKWLKTKQKKRLTVREQGQPLTASGPVGTDCQRRAFGFEFGISTATDDPSSSSWNEMSDPVATLQAIVNDEPDEAPSLPNRRPLMASCMCVANDVESLLTQIQITMQ